MFLKQSTSAVVLVGPVLDASGVAVTTAVIGDFTLTKNGTSATMSGNTISHSHNGQFLAEYMAALLLACSSFIGGILPAGQISGRVSGLARCCADGTNRST